VSVWTFVSEVEYVETLQFVSCEFRIMSNSNYNIFCFSEQREMWSLVRKPVPFRSNWSSPTLQYATRIFLEKIIEGLYGPGTGSQITVRMQTIEEKE
jgi:hypothetical protein